MTKLTSGMLIAILGLSLPLGSSRVLADDPGTANETTVPAIASGPGEITFASAVSAPLKARPSVMRAVILRVLAKELLPKMLEKVLGSKPQSAEITKDTPEETLFETAEQLYTDFIGLLDSWGQQVASLTVKNRTHPELVQMLELLKQHERSMEKVREAVKWGMQRCIVDENDPLALAYAQTWHFIDTFNLPLISLKQAIEQKREEILRQMDVLTGKSKGTTPEPQPEPERSPNGDVDDTEKGTPSDKPRGPKSRFEGNITTGLEGDRQNPVLDAANKEHYRQQELINSERAFELGRMLLANAHQVRMQDAEFRSQRQTERGRMQLAWAQLSAGEREGLFERVSRIQKTLSTAMTESSNSLSQNTRSALQEAKQDADWLDKMIGAYASGSMAKPEVDPEAKRKEGQSSEAETSQQIPQQATQPRVDIQFTWQSFQNYSPELKQSVAIEALRSQFPNLSDNELRQFLRTLKDYDEAKRNQRMLAPRN